MKKKIIALIIVTVVVIIAGICIGSVLITPGEILSALISGDNSTSSSIIREIRIPRVLLAFFVGVSLSAGGAVVQSVLKNPLASPFTLGVSAGASLGVAAVVMVGIAVPLLSSLSVSFAGLTFAVLTALLVMKMSKRLGNSSETIILVGMVLSLFISGVITLLAGISRDKYEVIMKWQRGTFASRGWEAVLITAAVTVIGVSLISRYSRELDILTFGDEQASSIGVETKKINAILLLTTAVLTGTAVAFSGVIGFIDLIAPHIVRKIFSPKHKYVVLLSALLGGMLMVAADLISRTVLAPRELPVSAVTAIIGAPFFAYIFYERRNGNA